MFLVFFDVFCWLQGRGACSAKMYIVDVFLWYFSVLDDYRVDVPVYLNSMFLVIIADFDVFYLL